MDKIQKTAFTDYNAPLSEPFRLHLKIKIYKTIILPVILYRCKTWSLTKMEHIKDVWEK
jgi:hypothetical protein